MSAQKQNNDRLGKAESKKRKRLSELGIEYDFPGYTALLPKKEEYTTASTSKLKGEPTSVPDSSSAKPSNQTKSKIVKTSEPLGRREKEATASKVKKQTP